MKKVRPCVVISSDAAGVLPLRLIVPLTGWQDGFLSKFWILRIESTPENGLSKDSGADTLQLRSVDFQRFDGGRGCIGIITEEKMRQIVLTLMATIDYQPIP